jgi:hypothetical protein
VDRGDGSLKLILTDSSHRQRRVGESHAFGDLLPIPERSEWQERPDPLVAQEQTRPVPLFVSLLSMASPSSWSPAGSSLDRARICEYVGCGSQIATAGAEYGIIVSVRSWSYPSMTPAHCSGIAKGEANGRRGD